MEIYEYKNYEDYLEHQRKWNAKKFGKIVYVQKNTIDEIVAAHGKNNAKTILCHGTRSGHEQRYFKHRYPEAEVIGTEIGPSANEAPMTVEWDFNKQKPEWVDKFDIVYSNSFDHSITPVECLRTWKDQLSEKGKLYLEYAESRSNVSESDPLGATNKEVLGFIEEAGLKYENELGGKIRHNGVVFICSK